MEKLKNLWKILVFKIYWRKRIKKEMNVFSAMVYIRKYLPKLAEAISEGRYIRLVFFKLFAENPNLIYFYLDKYWNDIYQITRNVDIASPGKEYNQRKNEALVSINHVKEMMEQCLAHR